MSNMLLKNGGSRDRKARDSAGLSFFCVIKSLLEIWTDRTLVFACQTYPTWLPLPTQVIYLIFYIQFGYFFMLLLLNGIARLCIC